jgi:predicted Zn-dependent peptidase
LEKKVSAVTAEQAAFALRKYIDPAKLIAVAVGSFGTKPQQ